MVLTDGVEPSLTSLLGQLLCRWDKSANTRLLWQVFISLEYAVGKLHIVLRKSDFHFSLHEFPYTLDCFHIELFVIYGNPMRDMVSRLATSIVSVDV